MINTIADPFARTETPINDGIENIAVPDFDEYPHNVPESMATDALSKEERRLFSDGERAQPDFEFVTVLRMLPTICAIFG